MEATEESTTMDTDEFTDTERPSLVDHYGTLAIQMIQANPWASVPEVMEYMIQTGPWSTVEQIMAVFRGRAVFRGMMRRLNIVRIATLRGEVGGLPIETGEPDGSIHWWAPYVQEGGEEYPISVAHLEEAMLQRYPHLGIDTEELLQPMEGELSEEEGTEEEEGENNLDVDMENIQM